MKPSLLLLALSAASVHAESFSYFHENVLGTSLELRISSSSEAAADRAEASVLAEIDRLSAVLNTWRNDSEISRWQVAGSATVSADLAAVLAACDQWTARSGGAFDARVASLRHTPRSLAGAKPVWTLDSATRTATFSGQPGDITVDALAKGYIIDQAVEKAAGAGIDGITLNIGGDLRVSGDHAEPVAIADPRNDAENAAPLALVSLRNQSIATSGNYRRGRHILDPRSGQPADHVISSSAIAPDACTADALATIFSVLQPAESLALADSLPGVSCLVVSRDGATHRSRSWPQAAAATQVAVPAAFELAVDFELDKPEAERYLRPYVAIWVEDKDGFPVRTLNLWILKGTKGLNWLSDLKRWSRSDKTRRLAEQTDLVPTISSATRNPGKYAVVWDGLDDNKQPMEPGDYTVYIEAAREKGTYQLIKHAFKVGGEPFKKELEGNVEVKAASLEYRLKTVPQ